MLAIFVGVSQNTCLASNLFERELLALRTSKTTFSETLEAPDLQRALIRASNLMSKLTEHLNAYDSLQNAEEKIECSLSKIEILGIEATNGITSTLAFYENDAKKLTLQDAGEQTRVLDHLSIIYQPRQTCSLLMATLDGTRMFYHTYLEAYPSQNVNAWQTFVRVHTCLDELSSLYWLAETALVQTLAREHAKFQPLWRYWHEAHAAAQNRDLQFQLTRHNLAIYLLRSPDKKNTYL